MKAKECPEGEKGRCTPSPPHPSPLPPNEELVLLKVWVSLYGYRKGYSMHYRIQQKLWVCIWLAHNGMQNCIRFWLQVLIHAEACPFPSFFSPASLMAQVQLKRLLEVCLREKEVLLSSALRFTEQHFLRPVLWAALLHPSWFRWSTAWLEHMCISTGKKEWQEKRCKKRRKWETHPSVNLNGMAQIATWSDKINISISGSVAICVHGIMHYLFLLSQLLPCICIHKNGIASLRL